MGARSGNNYLSAIRKLKADCWIEGVRILDPITHPALVKYARGIASLYDAQIERPAAMTYRLDDGDRIGLSYIQPCDAGEVEKLSAMFRMWAEVRGTTLNFAPEAHNSVLATMTAAAGFFAASDARFAQNLEDFYRAARHHDWCMTSNWTEFHKGSEHDAATNGASLEIVERSREGIRVSGRINLTMPGSLAEKLLMLPSPSDASGGIVFAVDCNAAGLRFDHHWYQSSDRPRTENLGCSAIFDRVAIPDERIFLRDDPARYRAMLDETGAADALIHQAAIRSLVKAEAMARADSGSTSSSDADRWREAAARLRTLIGQALAAAHMNQWGTFVPARAPLEEALGLFGRVNRAE